MIKLKFCDDMLTIEFDCGCRVFSGSLYEQKDPLIEYAHSTPPSCYCQKHNHDNMMQAAWIAASWEFNFPNGFAANAPDGFMGEFEGFVTRESFDKALHFVECFKSVKPLPVRAAA